MSKFTSGKYAGMDHKEVARLDPQYIVEAYETKMDNGGISNEMYRLASINLAEELEAENDDFDFSDMEDDDLWDDYD